MFGGFRCLFYIPGGCKSISLVEDVGSGLWCWLFADTLFFLVYFFMFLLPISSSTRVGYFLVFNFVHL